MSHTTRHSAAGRGGMPGAAATDFMTLVAEMVADQAPRLFAVVLEFGDESEGRVAAWGMAFDDHAYMTTADGRNQYALAEPENALRYVRRHPDITPHLVWTACSAPSHGQ
jgi:hypothetical protein